MATSAQAETPAPGWELTGHFSPDVMPLGSEGVLRLAVIDTGATRNTETTLEDTLPAGLEATGGEDGCTVTSKTTVECPVLPPASAGYTSGGPVVFTIFVKAVATVPGEGTDRASIGGGGAVEPASTTVGVRYGTPTGEPEFSSFDVWATNEDGTPDTQAGSHPYELTVEFTMNSEREPDGEQEIALGGEIRGVDVKTPPGLIGDPHAVPQCSDYLFHKTSETDCPLDTQVGWDYPDIGGIVGGAAVYNLVPPPGVAAQFGFYVAGNPTFLDARVRSGGDYGITEHVGNITQRKIVANSITLWGVPAAEGHDFERRGEEEEEKCLTDKHGGCAVASPPVPFLTLPTSCQGPQESTVELEGTWQDESAHASRSILTHDTEGNPTGFTGCGRLTHFEPSVAIAPDTTAADTPAGLSTEVMMPQGVNPEELATSGLKDTTVVLPEGVAINPGQATGLQACQPGKGPGDENLPLPGVDGEGEEWDGPPECPAASKVGTVEIATPLLPDKLTGNVYILQQNPPHLQLLVAASGDGVNLKLLGEVNLNPVTGQLTATFKNTPDFPFTTFKLAFSGGAQAALATPTACGTYESSADLTPWATPFVEEALSLSRFQIANGPGGAPCPGGGGGAGSNSLPFTPSLTAGSTTDQAGGFTNFSLLLQRGDGQQRIDGLQFKAPAGLTGELANVPLCTNAQAESNTCPEASKIGHTVVESGPGPYPLVIPEAAQPPAPIYLTEAYDGAPFGLSIVVPIHAGPFTLETQRVRARIEINPTTSALTVTTNPLPQVVAGIPTDLREVDAVIERPEFMVNPTNCNPQEFSGTAYGTPPPAAGSNPTGQPDISAPISSHFGVGSCQALKFEPKFTVSVSGKNSKAEGASLTTKVSYPSVPQGSDADIGYVKIELPKQLPSRLTTLQKACTSAQFEANPANCPSESKIGYATVHTPLLPVPLIGPVIFVSHGGEAFPSLTVVLQGDGVTIDLVGTTFISKAGITSTTFKTVPDDPFSTFELTLPQGKFSALAANVPNSAHYSLCGQKLTLPNEFVGQNGAPLKQSTPISVTGCSTALSISSHSVKKKTLTLSVYVPAAGKLKVSGKGLSSSTKTASGLETLTFKLTQKKAGKLKTTIKLAFTPSKGSKQAKTLKVTFKH